MENSEEYTFGKFIDPFYMFVNLLLFLTNIIGNSLVIFVIIRDKKLRTRTNYHVLAVSSADFLLAFPGVIMHVITVNFI